jgi:outer membrane immunogenic protein
MSASALALALVVGAPGAASAQGLLNTLSGGGPTHDWSGWFAGGQAGYAWGEGDYSIPMAFFLQQDTDVEGFLGGIHLGQNWQSGDAVFSIIADVNFGDVDGSSTGPLAAVGAAPAPANLEAEMNFAGSLRGRFGLASGRALYYVTAGVAIADIDHKLSVGAASASFSETHLGYTVGGGIEFAFTEMISGFIEGRYTDYGDESFGATGGFAAHRFDMHYAQVQAGFSVSLDQIMGRGY